MNESSFVWDSKAIRTGINTIISSRQSFLLHLKNLLDEYHGVSRPIEYYDLIAGIWLESLEHNIYCAWCEVLNSEITEEVDPIPVVRCTKHASEMQASVSWHRHLRAACAALLNGRSAESWNVSCVSLAISDNHRNQHISNLLGKLSNGDAKVLLTTPGFKCSVSDWTRQLWRWRNLARLDYMKYPVTFFSDVNWGWRKKKSTEYCKRPLNFQELIGVLLPLYIPVGLLEGFDDYRNKLLSNSIIRPQVVFSSNSLHGNPTFQILMAEWREEGTKLLYHQHGGGYGLEPDLTVEAYEIRVVDQFYSWGWGKEGTTVLPLSPAMPMRKEGSRFKHRILLNCLDLPKVPYRLMFTPMPGTILNMHRNTEDFLHAISNSESITIRPYPVDYGWNAVERLKRAAPKASLDYSSRGLMTMLESSLVVHNYLGTAWLESLGLNIPTICFFDPSVYIFREDSNVYIDALKAVGILHCSGMEAAHFVKSLGNDIHGWWKKSEVQKARNDFVELYANFSPNWAIQWETEFHRWLN